MQFFFIKNQTNQRDLFVVQHKPQPQSRDPFVVQHKPQLQS